MQGFDGSCDYHNLEPETENVAAGMVQLLEALGFGFDGDGSAFGNRGLEAASVSGESEVAP